MFTKITSAAAVALLASNLVAAQTFTDCDPTKESCRADPAFGDRNGECDFTQGKCDVFKYLDGTTLSYDDNGAVFEILKETNAPTVETPRYMFFGRLDVEVKPAVGQGVVTSIVLESDTLDEIDWEWVGGDDLQVQTNYFSKGDTTTYDRGAYHSVDGALSAFHTYSIEWTRKSVKWIVNGNTIRELKYEDAKGGKEFPQTPMQIKLGTWVAGRKDAPKGTVEWAGGYTNFDDAPFTAWYRNVKIVDYAGGDKPATGDIKEYVYGDKTGTWESIKVIKGDGSSEGGKDEDEDEKTTTKSATKTKETETSTKTKTSVKTTSTGVTTATTLTTAATTTTAAATETDEGDDETTETSAESTGEPTTVPEGAAGNVIVSMASLALVGAGVVAQLLL